MPLAAGRPGRVTRGPAGVTPPVGGVTLRVTNFKSIASVELPALRLTVLAGSNSSGKSSLLQSVLFFAQSYGEPAPVINGDLARLGEPRDVLRDGTESLAFEVGFEEVDPDGEVTPVAVRLALRAVGQGLRASEFSLLEGGVITLEADANGCPKDLRDRLIAAEVPLAIQTPGALNLPDESFLTVLGLQPGRLIYRASEAKYRANFEHVLDDARMSPFLLDELLRISRIAGLEELPDPLRRRFAELRHGRRRGIPSDMTKEEREALFRLYFQSEAPGGWAAEPISVGPLGTGRLGVRASPVPYRRASDRPVLGAVGRITDAARRMETFAGSLVYLGPLREDPRVAYPLGHTVTSLPVGEKGEFTAAYLESNKQRIIRHRAPNGDHAYDPLTTAVSRWSRYLGVADSVSVLSRGKLGHELELEVNGRRRDPTAIGVGASQLLPVIVLVLGAAPGQFVLLEQPELHLHPKVQSRLGDFFAWARPDVRLLIETHSEYLVTRLRLRAADGSINSNEVAALFAAQRVAEHLIEEGGKEEVDREIYSDFQRLRLDDQGGFDVWPPNFFDTLDADSVALARAVGSRLGDAAGNKSSSR